MNVENHDILVFIQIIALILDTKLETEMSDQHNRGSFLFLSSLKAFFSSIWQKLAG